MSVEFFWRLPLGGDGPHLALDKNTLFPTKIKSRFDDLIVGPNLWVGFGKAKPGPAVGLVGSYQNVAERLAEFRDAGISTFILAGSPHLEESLRIGQEVLPLLHARQAQIAAPVAANAARVA